MFHVEHEYFGVQGVFSSRRLGERTASSAFVLDDAGIGRIFDDSYGSRKGHCDIG